MIYTHAAAALVAASLAFTGAWQVQSWRFEAKENQRAQQELATERNNAAAAIRRTDNVVIAANRSRAREARLRADADGARAAVGGLRDAAAAALQAARSSHDACLDRAAAATVVLAQCADEYRSLGEKADRHASDLKTLIDAWPQ